MERRISWFRRLALTGALLAAAVVVLGAWVRLTDAGLGCPDWPGCYGHLYPQVDQDFGKALHEMVHRYFASILGLIIIGLLAFAGWNRKDRRQPLIPVVLLFIVVCLQGALGALTVTRLLKPLIVTSHLLGGLTTTGILCWLSMSPPSESLTARETSLRKFAWSGIALLSLQIALGGWTSTNYAAVACPDLPTCQRSWWPPMDFRNAFILSQGQDIDYTGGVLGNPARTAIHVTHRIGALVTGVWLVIVAGLTWTRTEKRRLRLAAALLAGAVLLQICIGLGMVHLGMPLPLATLHNAGAALLVVAMVRLLRVLSPARSQAARFSQAAGAGTGAPEQRAAGAAVALRGVLP